MLTPDGRYLVVRGRLWRAANPALDAAERERLTKALMRARRGVGAALRDDDREAERAARRAVHRAKVALGERGPVWWGDGAPDYNRRLVQNTPYREWYDEAQRWEEAILTLLGAREASVCPSEVARRVKPRGWRGHMSDVREAARRLARRGVVEVRQRGVARDPEEEWRGPIRIVRGKRFVAGP